MTHVSRRVTTPLAVAALTLGLSGCSADEAQPGQGAYRADAAQQDGTAADRRYLFANMRARADSQLSIQYAANLAQWLPNQQFSIDGADPEALSDLVVQGTVISAEPGPGYYIPGDDEITADADGGTETTFDDPRALWAVVVLTIDPGGAADDTVEDRVRVGITVDGTEKDTLLRGAGSLGEVVAVLRDPSHYDFAPGVHSVANKGTLLGMVEDEQVVFPALESQAENDEFTDGVDTWDEIEAESMEDKPVIDREFIGIQETP